MNTVSLKSIARSIVEGQYDPLTGNITKIQPTTQAQYDAIATKDAETLYVIVEAA